MAQNQYKFSMFDSYDYGTSAPKLEPKYEPEVTPAKKKQTKTKKNTAAHYQQVKEARKSHIASAKILACVLAVCSVFAAVLYLNVTLDEKATRINSINSDIEIAKSENVRLESALEGMVSIDKVEQFAQENLGMVKLEDYRITYFNSGEENHVVISGGKSYNDNTIIAKMNEIKEYFTKS